MPEPIEAEDPCVSNPCGPYSNCRVHNGHAVCSCQEDYFGIPPNCGPECVLDSDCYSNDLRCSQGRCISPCEGACGPNAECQVLQRKAICKCKSGFKGDPFSGCIHFEAIEVEVEEPTPCDPNPCGDNAYCTPNGRVGSCICNRGYYGDADVSCRPECVTNSDCRDRKKACVDSKCVNPCKQKNPCGINAVCNVVNHGPICNCLHGYNGDPNKECHPPPTGTVTEEIECDCGPHSQRRERHGICTCSCLSGYRGVPPNCRPECEINADCSQSLACNKFNCVDPCPGKCGPNARCRVVNHSPICTCHYGTTGNPEVGCNKIPEPVVTESPRDPCRPSPCGPNARCQSNGQVASCSCLKGFINAPPNCR